MQFIPYAYTAMKYYPTPGLFNRHSVEMRQEVSYTAKQLFAFSCSRGKAIKCLSLSKVKWIAGMGDAQGKVCYRHFSLKRPQVPMARSVS